MSWSCSLRLTSCDWIYIIPAPVSPIDKDSSFIVISRACVCGTIFCCINGIRMSGNNATMNHSLCCTYHIWKLTLAINVLNLLSNSQTDSVGSCLISLISVMHCDSHFGFLKSSIILIRIEMIYEFRKPKSESQCITEIKEIKQLHKESVWYFD